MTAIFDTTNHPIVPPFAAGNFAGAPELTGWENWMPLARHALYCDGIDPHVSTWPGWSGLTKDITRSIAVEGRVYSVAVSGLLSLSDIPADFPMLEQIAADHPQLPFDGGSAIAAPDGTWIEPPSSGAERIQRVRALAREMGDDLLDALDFRLVVEPGAAALAATRATPADADRLDAALEILAAAPRVTFPATERVTVDGNLERDDPTPLSDLPDTVPLSYRFADRRLHLLIADIARSPSVASAVTQAQLRLSDLLASTPQMEEALRHSDEQHAQIVRAIKQADPAAAQKAMREHVEATASYVRGFLE